MSEMKPAYLIAGTDEAKIARARGRLRDRAEREGGPGALELFEAGDGRRSPDVDAVVASLAAISLISSWRYLLVDGVDGWGKVDAERAGEALAQIPPETTVALVAHGKPPGRPGQGGRGRRGRGAELRRAAGARDPEAARR